MTENIAATSRVLMCWHCTEEFEPMSNRQRFCGAGCREANKVDQRRQSRRVTVDLARHADELDMTRGQSWPQTFVRQADAADHGLWSVPDDSQESREGNLQSYLHGQSGQLAWQMNGWLARETERQANGHPASYSPAYTYQYARDDKGRLVVVRDRRRPNVAERGGFRRTFVPVESCAHGLNGITVDDCLACHRRNRPERMARLDGRPAMTTLAIMDDYAEELAA